MIQLSRILPQATVHGLLPERLGCIRFNSKEVEPGDWFVAISGTQADGHRYIPAAVAAGARVVLCTTLPPPPERSEGVAYIRVEDTAQALAVLAGEQYGRPSEKLKLVGVTGTNGKTTIATLLYDLFTALGYTCGLISTVVYRIGATRVEATHTTPDPLTLNRLMAQMVCAGCTYCFMEVSSHSVVQGRIAGLRFAGGIFTNLTHDHLDYHKTFPEYLRAKQRFFDGLPGEAFALTNRDDRNGEVMIQNSAAGRKVSYALRTVADYPCRVVEEQLGGMELALGGAELWVQFVGRFNASNLAAVYGAAMELGAERDEVLRLMSLLRPVSGRFELIHAASGALGIVDYAHTPDALQNVIDTVGELRGGAAGRGEFIVVVGCGGNRDAAKRPIMARIAAEGGTRAILTSDNPRGEEPEAILAQMRAGLGQHQLAKTLVIADRREAIRTAAALAMGRGDLILVAGKGHESYQEVKGVRHHFDDREELLAAFEGLFKQTLQ